MVRSAVGRGSVAAAPALFTLLALLLVVLAPAWVVGASARERAEPRGVSPRGPLLPSEQAMVALFEAAAPSVAYITTEVIHHEGFFGSELARGAGSGFVWDGSGTSPPTTMS